MLAFAAVAAPDSAHAQQQEAVEQECTAEIDPTAVQVGQSAVSMEVRLSREIGEITDFTAPEGSGLALASPEDLAKTDMTREQTDEEPQPIQMSTEEGGGATVWVNTAEASPGSYRVVFASGQAECAATLEVEKSGQ